MRFLPSAVKIAGKRLIKGLLATMATSAVLAGLQFLIQELPNIDTLGTATAGVIISVLLALEKLVKELRNGKGK